MATINGTENDETLDGTGADDTINGAGGHDILHGLGGNDTLDGGTGADDMFGGAGNDVYYVDQAGDTVSETTVAGVDDGGVDLVSASVSFTLTQYVENLSLTGVADLSGAGNASDNAIFGNLGNNSLYGSFGNDTLEGGVGADFLSGGQGTDTASYSTALGAVSADLASPGLNIGDAAGDTYLSIENLTGSAFADILGGDALANTINGGDGNDLISAGDGNDRLIGGAGADHLDGQVGVDAADYSLATAGITAFLGGAQLNTGEATGDAYVSIEDLSGTGFADILGGDAGNNRIEGNNGSDYMFGVGGSDYMLGGDGNDIIEGGAGNDAIDGGNGIDVASYRDAAAGISIDATNSSLGSGDGAGDVLVNIENIWGSDFNDTISGSDTVGGQIYGFGGNDTLDGRGGNDVFYGGTGADTITTGTGNDDIFFLHYDTEGNDTITDFTQGSDHLTVSRYWFGFGSISGGAAALTSANADFITGGTTATSNHPTFFWNQTTGVLQFDPDGTGAGAAVTLATLTNGASLTLNDIWSA